MVGVSDTLDVDAMVKRLHDAGVAIAFILALAAATVYLIAFITRPKDPSSA